ncbi:MAG: hypothetical protein IJK04_04525 [Kiritimatiellae bacterium]|nr:hypothetical protein [Kiritimatiellia bacterium]
MGTEKRGEVAEVVPDGFLGKEGKARGALVVADKELPKVVVDLLLAFRHLHHAGADHPDVVLAEATAHKRRPRRGVREKLVLRY